MDKRTKLVPTRGAPAPPDVIGDSAVAVRQELFDLMGLDKAQQAGILAHSVSVLLDELGARRVQRLVVRSARDQEHIEAFTDVDHSARQAAADKLLTLVGAYPSRNIGKSGTTAVQVNISFLPMEDGPPQVIEASARQVVDK